MQSPPLLQGYPSGPAVENASTADPELFPAAQEKSRKARAAPSKQGINRLGIGFEWDTNASALFRDSLNV